MRVREENTDVDNNTFSNDDGGNVGVFIENDGVPGAVEGSPGNDTFVATAGTENHDGAGGSDTIDMVNAGANGSVVNLSGFTPTASSAATGNDTLTSIETSLAVPATTSSPVETASSTPLPGVMATTRSTGLDVGDIVIGGNGADAADFSGINRADAAIASGSVRYFHGNYQ